MGTPNINILTELETAKVSLVKRGANLKPRFPITKSEGIVMNKEVLKAILEVEAENEGKITEVFKNLSDKGTEAVTGALRLINAYTDELPEDLLPKLAELSGFKAGKIEKAKGDNPFGGDDDEKKEFMAWRKAKKAEEKKAARLAAKEAAASGGAVAKALAELTPELSAQLAPIFKAHQEQSDAAHAEDIAKAEERTEDAKEERTEIAKTLATERGERQTKEWIHKAETELAHDQGESSEGLGKMLRDLHDHDPKVAEAQFKSMKAASDAIKKSDMLVAAGVPGSPAVAGSAAEKIEKMAKQLVLKAEKPMTQEAAEAFVVEQNPDLYNEYLNENPKQTGASD